MVTKAKIALLKRKLKRYYLQYLQEVQNNSCGKQLTEYMSSTAYSNKRLFNETLVKLKKVDPAAAALKPLD